jgi:hypothetical protein
MELKEAGFLKAVRPLPGDTKAALNRKGNELFNSGDIDAARRIFVTTGYSDGLIRIADLRMAEGDSVSAVKLYMAAGAKEKAAVIIEKMAQAISYLIEKDNENG